jgi:hypothetical protein
MPIGRRRLIRGLPIWVRVSVLTVLVLVGVLVGTMLLGGSGVADRRSGGSHGSGEHTEMDRSSGGQLRRGEHSSGGDHGSGEQRGSGAGHVRSQQTGAGGGHDPDDRRG